MIYFQEQDFVRRPYKSIFHRKLRTLLREVRARTQCATWSVFAHSFVVCTLHTYLILYAVRVEPTALWLNNIHTGENELLWSIHSMTNFLGPFPTGRQNRPLHQPAKLNHQPAGFNHQTVTNHQTIKPIEPGDKGADMGAINSLSSIPSGGEFSQAQEEKYIILRQ